MEEEEHYFMLIGFETTSMCIIKMQIDTLQHTHTHTRGKYAISSPIRPANDLPHLLQSDVFQQHKDRSHLIGEPALHNTHHMLQVTQSGVPS